MSFELKGRSILIFDIETDSLNTKTAKVKFFGAYSYLTDKFYELQYPEQKGEIQALIDKHKSIVGFNISEFDIPILENNLKFSIFNNKIDLYTVSKQRLNIMGFKIKSFSLREIAKELKLGEEKGELDFHILEKETLTSEEIADIKKYLRQDVVVTKSLFEYFNTIFQSVSPMLSKKDQETLVHIKSSPASLSYRAILNNAGVTYEFSKMSETPAERRNFEGAFHIENRQEKYTGNIVSIDFTSMYPHMIIANNLLSPKKGGWKGSNYLKTQGEYDNSAPGKIESSLKRILLDRLEAKKIGNKPKNLSYKILINAFYGSLGNNAFKTTYDPIAAGDVTGLARIILKRMAKTLEDTGFEIIYGFTDNCYVNIPKGSSKEELMTIANKFIEDVQKNFIFPQETFQLELDKEMKFIWFAAMNHYLYVDNKDKVVATSTLLDKNTPEAIMMLYNNYMCPKIVKELDVNFTEEELKTELLKIIENNIELTAEDFSAQPLSDYKVKTSIQYQISEKYGVGKHKLIPNTSGVGVGKAKSTKSNVGVRYCTIQEFKAADLNSKDVDIKKMLSYLKPFIKKEKNDKKE